MSDDKIDISKSNDVEVSEITIRMLLRDTLADYKQIVKRQNITIALSLALDMVILIGFIFFR